MIALNPQASLPSFDTVSAYLGWDHDRLDALLADVTRMVDDGELERAEYSYGDFQQGLERHIRIEEDVLFPVFEQKTGMTHGPTEVMRREHQIIKEAMQLMREGLAAGKGAAFHEGRELLEEALPSHNHKEEHVLYPTIDRLLAAADRTALVAVLMGA
jgi:iron-sulfur cluster repair protein YtfE (RIC family)